MPDDDTLESELTPEERAGMKDETLVDEGDPERDPAGRELNEDGTPKQEEPEPAQTEEAEVAAALEAEKAESEAAATKEPEPETEEKPAEEPEKETAPASETPTPAKTTPEPPVEQPAATEQPADPQAVPDELGTAPPVVPVHRPDENARERLEAIPGEKQKLAEQVEDGEISVSEMRQRTNKLDAEERELDHQVMRYQNNIDALFAHFSTEANKLVAEHPEYRTSPRLYKMMDDEVRRIQGVIIKRGGNQYDPAILQAAHENVQTDILAIAGKKPAPAAEGGAKPNGGGTKATAPPGLGGLPAAEGAEVNVNKFAHLDKLGTEEREQALAKMSEAERDEYLQGAD